MKAKRARLKELFAVRCWHFGAVEATHRPIREIIIKIEGGSLKRLEKTQ